MKIDAYTKVILTLIAVALVVLAVRSLQNPPVVSAQQGVQHVIIDGLDVGGNLLRSSGFGLPVHDETPSIISKPVVIKGIDIDVTQRVSGLPVYLVDKATGLPKL